MKIFNKNEWKKVKLGDIFNLQMGKTPLRENKLYWNKGEYNWISISDMNFSERYVSFTKEKITNLAVKESGIKIIPKNTVIMSFKLSIGKVKIVKDDIYSNEAIMAFIPKENILIDKNFLYYSLKSVKWNEGINKAVKGLTLNKNLMSQKEIFLPDLAIQKEIANNLDSIDNLLELRKKQLFYLKELNKSLFTTMFGDIKTNDKNWKLFEIKEISNIITRGKTPKYALSSNIFVINQACIYWDKIKYENMKFHIEDESLLFLKNKDVLINSTGTGTLGRMNIIQNIIHEKFTIDSHVMLVRLKDEKTLPLYFINIFMNEEYQKDLLLKCVNGSTNQIELSKEKFSKFKIPVPPIELQNKFAERIEKIEKLKFIISAIILNPYELLKNKGVEHV